DVADFDYPELGQVEFLKGDIRDKALVDRAMQGMDWVVHTAAALPLYPRSEIYGIDVDGTRCLLQAAQSSGVKRFVHISSTAVYGIPDHHPLREDDRLEGVGPYGEAKILAEEACLELRRQGLCVPILRPKTFIGPERLGVFAIFYEWASEGRHFPMIGNGRNRYQLLDVEDLCEAVYLCLTLPETKVNDTFNIGAGEFATMREDYQAVLDDAGFGRRIIPFPAAPAIWALRLLELLRLSPLYKWVYETASKDSFVSIDKARQQLGFDPRHSNREALVRNYRWYLEQRGFFDGQTGISHRAPWKQRALKWLKFFF
ncbi:MAG: NAD-dependent epimerase/dehydratase family protein, partial [Lentisphaerae bacterium]|nr:NAD-dependent epimerase/dehydratase family protein [Lentisphaerota bacterium]